MSRPAHFIFMHIRKFRLSDAAELARLHRGTIRSINVLDYPPKQIAVWSGRVSARRFRESAKNIIRYVAIKDNKIVGFGDFEKKGEMTGLYVHKDYQNKGVGQRLLKMLERQALKIGMKEFKLSSTITALDFYKRQGYKVIRKSIHPIRNQRLIVYKMKKRLSSNL